MTAKFGTHYIVILSKHAVRHPGISRHSSYKYPWLSLWESCQRS